MLSVTCYCESSGRPGHFSDTQHRALYTAVRIPPPRNPAHRTQAAAAASFPGGTLRQFPQLVTYDRREQPLLPSPRSPFLIKTLG